MATAKELREQAAALMRDARTQQRAEQRVGEVATLSIDDGIVSVSALIDVASTRQSRGKSAIVLDQDHSIPMGDSKTLTVYVKGYLRDNGASK